MRDWMKDKRIEKGMTQAQLAETLGISEAYYCLIENGERQKTLDVGLLCKLSTAFAIPVEQIVELEVKP